MEHETLQGFKAIFEQLGEINKTLKEHNNQMERLNNNIEKCIRTYNNNSWVSVNDLSNRY